MMERKLVYQKPEIDLIALLYTDIITTSGNNDIDEDAGENDGEWL